MMMMVCYTALRCGDWRVERRDGSASPHTDTAAELPLGPISHTHWLQRCRASHVVYRHGLVLARGRPSCRVVGVGHPLPVHPQCLPRWIQITPLYTHTQRETRQRGREIVLLSSRIYYSLARNDILSFLSSSSVIIYQLFLQSYYLLARLFIKLVVTVQFSMFIISCS